jgi:hypothetical protein
MEPLFSLASERPLSGLLQHPAAKSATVLRATGLSYEAVSRPKKSIHIVCQPKVQWED